jgi:hypothetical protein
MLTASTVVPAATKDQNRSAALPGHHPATLIHHGAGRIFHEHNAGNVVVGHRPPVDLAKLVTRQVKHGNK